MQINDTANQLNYAYSRPTNYTVRSLEVNEDSSCYKPFDSSRRPVLLSDFTRGSNVHLNGILLELQKIENMIPSNLLTYNLINELETYISKT